MQGATKTFLWICKVEHMLKDEQEGESGESKLRARSGTLQDLESQSPLHSFVYGMRRLLQANASSHVRFSFTSRERGVFVCFK